jgi:hypothetical protein
MMMSEQNTSGPVDRDVGRLSKQLRIDHQSGDFGDALAGYAGRAAALEEQVDFLRADADRLLYLLRHLPGDALRYVAGELADTGDIDEFRAAIDRVMASNAGNNWREAPG